MKCQVLNLPSLWDLNSKSLLSCLFWTPVFTSLALGDCCKFCKELSSIQQLLSGISVFLSTLRMIQSLGAKAKCKKLGSLQ